MQDGNRWLFIKTYRKIESILNDRAHLNFFLTYIWLWVSSINKPEQNVIQTSRYYIFHLRQSKVRTEMWTIEQLTFRKCTKFGNCAKRAIVETTYLTECTFLSFGINQTTACIEAVTQCFEILAILKCEEQRIVNLCITAVDQSTIRRALKNCFCSSIVHFVLSGNLGATSLIFLIFGAGGWIWSAREGNVLQSNNNNNK